MTRNFNSPIDSLRIRSLKPDDIEQFNDLERDIWDADPLFTPEEARERARHLSGGTDNEYGTNLVATIDDEIVGTMGYFVDRIRLDKSPNIARGVEQLLNGRPSLSRTAIFAHIYELGVHPDFRQRGIATRLAIAGLTAIRQSGMMMGKFHFNEATKQRIVTPASMEEFGVVEVQSGIEGFGQHPDLIRTQYIGNIDSSLDALHSRLDTANGDA